jgi:WD40 repeat protein
VGIWDLASNRLLQVFDISRGLFTADNAGLAFSPDNSQFAFMAGTNAMLLRVNSGELIQDWPIPPGYVEDLAFDPASHLYASHCESADVAAATLSSPTTVRIRELLPGGGMAELLELPEFNLGVRGAAWAPDASFVLIAGSQVKDGLTNRFLEAVSPTAKTSLWTLRQNLRAGEGACFALDAAGRRVAFSPGHPKNEGTDWCWYLLEAKTADRVRTLAFPPYTFNTSAKLLAALAAPGAWSLRSLADDSLLALLQLSGAKPASFPVFSGDGGFFAWGKQDGTVSVCEVKQIRRRLGELKLGW